MRAARQFLADVALVGAIVSGIWLYTQVRPDQVATGCAGTMLVGCK
jgi:hypothetical protein